MIIQHTCQLCGAEHAVEPPSGYRLESAGDLMEAVAVFRHLYSDTSPSSSEGDAVQVFRESYKGEASR